MGNQNKISKKRKQKQINDKENIENIEKINNIKSNDLLSPSILGKIKSKYNLSNIFDYVKDDNFKYKLFKYSKLFQEKLELNLTKYRVKYLERFKINPKIFLNFIEFGSDISLGKDIIKKGLTNYLAKNKIEENIFQSFVIEYFKKYFKENDDYFHIDIFSPVFDVLSTSEEIFEKMFIIIKVGDIKKQSLESNYSSCFEKLKNSKMNNYSLSYSFWFPDELLYFNDFIIDGKNLKALELKFSYDINKTIDSFKQKIFLNPYLKKNLVYLDLVFSGETIDSQLFENINDFYLLKELNIERIKFNEILVLELPDLIKLKISFCNNIALSQNNSSKLEKIFFNEFTLTQLSGLYKFPKLEEAKCDIKTLDIIDLSSLINLKKLEINSRTSAILDDIQNKIPTLLSLDIVVKEGNKNDKIIEVEENNDTKVKQISLILYDCFPTVKFNINKFENLSLFKFNISNKTINLFEPKIYFPLFSRQCNITFNYLRIFEFSTLKNYYDYIPIPFEDIQNLYNNLNQFTNLKSFKLRTVSESIKNDFYENFIKSLLLLEISEIELELMNDVFKHNVPIIDYSEKEIKAMLPSINIVKFKKLEIKKLHDSLKNKNPPFLYYYH